MLTVYYDLQGPPRQTGFRGSSEAWWVPPTRQRSSETCLSRFLLSEALYWSFFHLELVSRFEQLPHLGLLGAYEEGDLLSEALPEAAAMLREVAESLPPVTFDWWCATQMSPVPTEYRLAVSAQSIKAELHAFADFIQEASRQGLWVQLWL